MKKLLLILILGLTSVLAFSQGSDVPKGVIYNEKGFQVGIKKDQMIFNQLDKTNLSNSKYAVPSSSAVKTYVNSMISDSTSLNMSKYYQVNPTLKYYGITSLDTNTYHYGYLYSTAVISSNNTLDKAWFRDKTLYLDNAIFTQTGSGYKFAVSDTMNTTMHIGKMKDNGRGGFLLATTASTSNRYGVVMINLGRYTTDSLLQVSNGYNDNSLFYASTAYNRGFNLKVDKAELFGWTNLLAIGGLNNCKVTLEAGRINQYLPYSIVTGDQNKGTLGSISGTLTNSNVTLVIDQADIMDEGLIISPTMVNSRIVVRVNNCKRYNVGRFPLTQPLIYVAGSTDATSQIVIEGNFYTESKPVVEIGANVNLTLKGTFVTASTTEGVIKLSTTATNVKLMGCNLHTGFTACITAASARSITLGNGVTANVAVDGNTTAVGGTLLVNTNY